MRFIYLLLTCLFFGKAISQDTTRLTLLFAGDIMGHDSQIASAYKSKGVYDYSTCFQFAKPYIQSVDLAIGNLELTLAGPPYKGYPQFSSPDALAVTLKDIGFDILVTANNHSVDRGRKGIERTIQVLDSLNIPHTGTFVDEVDRLNNYPLMAYKNGFKLALLNYTYGTNGIPIPSPNIVNPIDTALIGKDLAKAKGQQPDVIIVFMHWGTEYERLPRRSERAVADYCFNKGVQLVIGSHPHVLQPMEWNKEKNQLIVYSLGNYVSGQRKQYTDGGAMAYVGLEKIRYTPDSTITHIDSAGYYLQWVYRTVDSQHDYYICPVNTFEKNNAGFIADAGSREALKSFASDSRTLYNTHNKSVPEIKQVPSDSIIAYKVIVELKTPENGEDLESFLAKELDTFYGVELLAVAKDEPQMIIALGNYRNKSQVEHMATQLLQQGKKAWVGVFLNGSWVKETH